MQCPSCNTDNPAGNRFCESCGNRFALICHQCGHENGPTARFCGDCGTGLTSPTQFASSARAPKLAGGNLAPQAEEPARASPTWGELKIATVLFADIVSSTEQIADLGPEEAMERLQPAVLQMCDAVERFGGTVVRTLGDGIMALFGVPRALEGHARLACEAALRIQAIFLNDTQGLSVRVGIHTGQVASNPAVGDSARGSGVHGLTIHLASRVMASADPGGICITDACQVQVREHYDLQTLGMHSLKGITGQVALYTLLSSKVETGSVKRNVRTPFRGRSREMGLLQLALHRASNGSAPVIGVSGEPGTGKSRLCYEFARWCQGRDVAVHEVRAQLYGHATPLQPVLELLRNCFLRIAHGDDAASVRDKIVQRLALTGAQDSSPLTEVDHALLADFLGVADPRVQLPSLNPRARHARLLAIVRQLVRQPDNGTILLLMEDLHWLDEASMDFVSMLVEAVVGTRILLVLNYRPMFRADWQTAAHFQRIELTELSSEDTSHIVRELISHRRELLDICELIARRSGGNPFFAEELVHSLAESGVLSGEPGTARNSIDSIERTLPSNVQSVVGARIDRLSEPDKILLQMCAIIGKEIPLTVLEKVAAPSIDDVARGLEQLCAAELMQPQPDEDGPRFAFRHPLIQEVAYSTQLKARRTALHAVVAEAMEDYYRTRGDEFAALIAHHYESAAQFSRAATYLARAAQWVGTTNPAQAIKHWHKVRALLQGNENAVEDSEKIRAMACSQICLLSWREGFSQQDVQPFLEEAMQIASKVDQSLTPLLLMIEGRMLQASGGSVDWYVERVRQALELAEGQADEGRVATLNAALSQAYGWAGLLKQALTASDIALDGVRCIAQFDREFIGFDPGQWILGMRGRLLMRLGRQKEAQECWALIPMAEVNTVIDPAVKMIVHLGYIEHACWTNDTDLAKEHLESLSALAEKHAIPYLHAVTINCRGMVNGLIRDFPEASQAFSDALKLIRNGNIAIEYETEILANLAECHRRSGRLPEARAIALEAIEVSRQRCTRLTECRALLTLGSAMLDDQGFVDQSAAERVFQQAENLINESGAAIYQTALLLERARLPYLAKKSTVVGQ